MPASPWLLTQTLHDLLFAHWPIDADVLRPLVPPQLPLDRFDGRAWVGVVPFEMTNVAPRLVPALPWMSAFPELNVRTYVTVDGKPGVYFFSLDATNPVAVWSARALFGLPYFVASIDVARGAAVNDQRIAYYSRRTGGTAAFDATYGPTGPCFVAHDGSLEYFLTERYCLYTADPRSGAVSRTDIHHPPWALQRADADIRVNTMGAAAGIALPSAAPHLLFTKRQDTVAWLPAAVRRPR